MVDKVILGITCLPVLCFLYLLAYNNCSDNKNNSKRELSNHQNFAWGYQCIRSFQASLQYTYRFERRKIGCRIASGKNTGDRNKRQTGEPEKRITKVNN